MIMETLEKKIKSSTIRTYKTIDEVVQTKMNLVQKILDKLPEDSKKKLFTK